MAFAIAASLPVQADVHPEAGAFLFQKYSPKDYSASPQNWGVVRDARGVLYVGNTDGLLEFDGANWRLIPLSVRSSVRALAIDSHGTIFVGGQRIFGYLAPDALGVLQFVSLLDKVPATDRSFSDVWDVLPTSDGVYFSSHRRLFLYTPTGVIKVFRPNNRFGRAFLYHQQLFITSSDRGLLTIRNRELAPILDGPAVRANLLYASGATPLLAASRKLYRFSPKAIEPFSTAADQYFQDHGVESVAQLPGGDIAVGTKNGGLVFLTQKGQIERVLHIKDGLPSEWITSISTDQEGAIWVATDSGLSRLVRKVSSYGEPQGIKGNVISIGRLGGVLYAGTSLGLFRLRVVPGAEPVFDPVPEIQDMVLVIAQHGDLQLVGGKNGVYLLSSGKVQQITTAAVIYDIGFSQRDPTIIYTAGSDGIQMLKREGEKWKVINMESRGGHEFRMVLEDSDGRVWATAANTIWRIDFSTQPATVEQFNATSGIPAGFVNVYRLRGHPVFASESGGLLQFSESAKRFVPDSEFGSRFSDGHLGVSLLMEDPLKNFWITGSGYHGILHGQNWFPEPLFQAGLDEIYASYFDPDGTSWASGASGTMFRHQGAVSEKQSGFGVLLRRVMVMQETRMIFGGDGVLKQRPKLLYRDNAVRFEFRLPFFENEAAVEYQVRLDGSDKDWTAWAKDTRKDYTNLLEGRYTFHVRARNPHGTVTPEVSFRFSMLPPWYRTWWAYAFYVAVFLLAGWLILRWRLRELQERNKWLERVIEERTAEVRSERDQNEALLLNILPKPVASELRTTGSVKPTAFEDVTVCFSDFVGFTLSSEKLPAEELISSLNEYFTAFDEIIGRYGLEKLKTIGDAYMFAGGLPNASPSHAVDSVLAALEMVDVARKLARPEKGVDWSIRLGLYSGPVVSGVVGVRKFAFDIWGNTVNFASRMESAGSANRVNLSQTTGSRVFEFIDCEPRGPVRIKEGREMEMFFALRPKPELLAGPMIDGIPEAFRIKYEQVFSKPPKSFPNLNGSHDS